MRRDVPWFRQEVSFRLPPSARSLRFRTQIPTLTSSNLRMTPSSHLFQPSQQASLTSCRRISPPTVASYEATSNRIATVYPPICRSPGGAIIQTKVSYLGEHRTKTHALDSHSRLNTSAASEVALLAHPGRNNRFLRKTARLVEPFKTLRDQAFFVTPRWTYPCRIALITVCTISCATHREAPHPLLSAMQCRFPVLSIYLACAGAVSTKTDHRHD